MEKFVNISAYKFAPLQDLRPLRTRLMALSQHLGLKGTILLSGEGINLFVAGRSDGVDGLVFEIRRIPGLETLEPKRSESAHQPFNRMLVRIKKEIIAFGVPDIDPARKTAPKIPAQTLKQWLDEGRPFTLLDTRNDYEIKLGTFKNALPIGVRHFRDFPAAVQRLPENLKEQPVVMFCTGGIRCEKAGPCMEKAGFQNVFQLDGGILKYFEECGGAHYEGECFVFDQRVGVNPNLLETDSAQCFRCLTPLTSAEQEDPRYVPGQSCPHCHLTAQEQMQRTLERRQEKLRLVSSPLPGSEPYDNFRPITVPKACDGLTVIDAFSSVVCHVPRSEWEQECARGFILDAARRPVPATAAVRAGERYLHKFPQITEPPVNADIRILHEDEALIVLDKPAPLPMHAGGRFNRNTLQYLLNLAYHPEKPRPAHRLDANTTGLVLLTRSRKFASRLQPQFAGGKVEKRYLAQVQGSPSEDAFACDAPIAAQAGEVGSRDVDWESGLPARTLFQVLKRLDNNTTLLEARPLTGRTNQIRVHLWSLGLPICGDPIYLPGGALGSVQTLNPLAPPLRLHAWRLRFIHPLRQVEMEFTAPTPPWA